MISAMARASAAPENRSRAIARDSTEVAQAPAAWTTRPVRRLGRSVARPHHALPTKNTAKPISTGQRRPYRSEIGPTTSCPTANTARKTVMADVTAALDTFRDAAICGSDGSRILVASVPVAASAARTAICRKVEETSGRGAAATVETVWSVMGAPGEYDIIHIKKNGLKNTLWAFTKFLLLRGGASPAHPRLVCRSKKEDV